jgi:hypothetical protein
MIKLLDIMNSPEGEELIFEGEKLDELLEGISGVVPYLSRIRPETLRTMKRIRVSRVGAKEWKGERFGFAIGRIWSYE